MASKGKVADAPGETGDLGKTDETKDVCFVICPIGADDSDTRRRSELLLRHVIQPVAAMFNLAVVPAHKDNRTGMITTQVINHLIDDKMVVADLTDSNPNVFYELAVRHAVRKPYVQILAAGQPAPFDVAGIRYISVDYSSWDSAVSAKKQLEEHFKNYLENGAQVESPISNAVDLTTLSRSADPGERRLADVVTELGQIKAQLQMLVSAFGATSSPGVWSRGERPGEFDSFRLSPLSAAYIRGLLSESPGYTGPKSTPISTASPQDRDSGGPSGTGGPESGK